MTVIDLIISIVLTAGTYLLFPFLIIVFKLRFKKLSHVIIFTIINALIVYTFFAFIWFLLEGSANASTAGFWGLLSFMLLKKYAFSKNPDVTNQTNNIDTRKSITTLDANELYEVQTLYNGILIKVSDLLQNHCNDSDSPILMRNYILFEYNLLQYFWLVTMLLENQRTDSSKQISHFFNVNIFPSAELLWNDDAPKIVFSTLNERITEYKKVLFKDLPLKKLLSTPVSIVLGPRINKIFQAFVGYSLYYIEHQRIPCLEDLVFSSELSSIECMEFEILFSEIANEFGNFVEELHKIL